MIGQSSPFFWDIMAFYEYYLLGLLVVVWAEPWNSFPDLLGIKVLYRIWKIDIET